MKQFTARTTGSARLHHQACSVLPRGSEHAWTPSIPYPLFMNHGKGSRVWDVDGNEYVDYILAGGPLILGHNHEGLRKSMMDLIGRRTWFHGFCDEMEMKAAEKIIRHFPAIERVRFTCSGTEANAAAARIARSFTGKKKIIKFLAGYHGWSDQFMTDMEVPGSGRFVSMGVPDEILDLTVLVPPNDLDALERAFAEHASDGGRRRGLLRAGGRRIGPRAVCRRFSRRGNRDGAPPRRRVRLRRGGHGSPHGARAARRRHSA